MTLPSIRAVLPVFLVLGLLPAAGPSQSVVHVSAGGGHSLALLSNGTVYAWGSNASGQCGQPNTTPAVYTPTLVPGLDRVVEIAAGGGHSLALKDDGTTWAWGWNFAGQLGNGSYSDSHLPTQVIGVTCAKAISAEGMNSMLLKGDGTVWVFGDNNFGQVGDGTILSPGSPYGPSTPVRSLGVTNALAISAGACGVALRWFSNSWSPYGNVLAWGVNDYGQLGNGSTDQTIVPYAQPVLDPINPSLHLGMNHMVAISTSGQHTLALYEDGTVWAWGRNLHGAVGDGSIDTFDAGVAKPVQAALSVAAIAIDAGGGHSLALTRSGNVWAWGENSHGQTGQQPYPHPNFPNFYPFQGIPTPAQVNGINNICEVSAGLWHNLAIRNSDGSVWAWGGNATGELGQGNATPFSITPVQVSIPGAVPSKLARVSVKSFTSAQPSSWTSPVAREMVLKASQYTAQLGIRLQYTEFVEIDDPTWSSAPISGTLIDAFDFSLMDSPCAYHFRDDAINLYLNQGAPTVHGIAGFPGFVPNRGGIIFMTDSGPFHSHAQTLAHELGHFFGLHHTFATHVGVETNGACGMPASNCATAGDSVCDTPPSPNGPDALHDPTVLETLYGGCSCEHSRLRYNIMSYYDDSRWFTQGQAQRVASFLPYRTHVMVGDTVLTRDCATPWTPPWNLTLHAPAGPNSTYFTLPSLSPPLAIGSGFALSIGEMLLPTSDSYLQLALVPGPNPFASGISGSTDANGIAVTTVGTLPAAVVGTTLFFQSVVLAPQGSFASQVVRVTIGN